MKTLILTTILAAVLVQGCGPPMTRGQKLLFGALIAAQAADGWTTNRYIDIGGTELNPMLGARPDNESIALLKIGTVLALWGLGEVWPEHREGLYSVGIISGACAAGHNDRLYEKYKGERR